MHTCTKGKQDTTIQSLITGRIKYSSQNNPAPTITFRPAFPSPTLSHLPPHSQKAPPLHPTKKSKKDALTKTPKNEANTPHISRWDLRRGERSPGGVTFHQQKPNQPAISLAKKEVRIRQRGKGREKGEKSQKNLLFSFADFLRRLSLPRGLEPRTFRLTV